MKISSPAIPSGSTVVVIGANGYIALETCEKLLEAGFRVRGTVRDVERHRTWMHALFDVKWPTMFELVQVPNFQAEGAFDAAFQGAAGVIYVSTPVTFDLDPAKTVTATVNGTINTLEAAARANVKRYVLAGSSKAVTNTTYNIPYTLNTSMYNYDAILRSIDPPIGESSFDRSLALYSAGRTLAELAFWTWVARNKPPFTANSVVPDGNFGRLLAGKHSDVGEKTSVGMLRAVLAGNWDAVPLKMGYYIDVQDTARLLVAGVALPSVVNERVLAYVSPASWNDIRQCVRDFRPDLVTGPEEDVIGAELSDAHESVQRAEEILREVGRSVFTSKTEMLKAFVDSAY